LEALRYLRQEKALTLQQFSAIDDLLNELGEARQRQPAANAQAHDTREALNSLSREMDISRGILNERTNRLRELQIQRSDFKLRIEDLHTGLAFVENAIATEEAQLDEPLAASEEMGRNLAHLRERATQAEASAIAANLRVEELCLKLSFAGQSL
jgi:chromosome segregation ATPase